MSYKNTVKLFASNFTLVWKQLAYLFCCLLVFALCSTAVVNPIIDLLKSNGIVADLKEIVKAFYSAPDEIALAIGNVLRNSISIIFSNFSKIWLSFFGTVFLCILFPYMLLEMSKFNLTSVLHQKFTMNMDVNYAQNAIKVLWKSIQYALANIIFNLPFVALSIVLIEIYLVTATTIWSALIGLTIISALIILLNSIKSAIFSYYTTYMVEHNSGPFVAFGKSLVHTFKSFWKILSMSIALQLTIIFVNSFIAVFTFFSGLFVTIPATYVITSVFYAVTYFNITGERYYLSNSVIFNPVKHIIKKDDYVSISVPEAKEVEVTTTVMKKKYNKKTNNIKKIKNKG